MNFVYIMTRNRHDNLKRIVPIWLSNGFAVVLVVEGSEYIEHAALRMDMGWNREPVGISATPYENQGIGYKRRYAVNNARLSGHKCIVMSDDDMQPARGSDMNMLIEEAEKPGVLGVGAVQRLHHHFTKGATAVNKGVILCPGGWGMQLFALNIDEAVSVGNFDEELDCFGEDHELVRNGIAAGIPWLVHCGVECSPLGSRYASGGISSLYPVRAERSEAEIECRRIIHQRWPKYTSEPEARSRMAWSKMLDDFIPDWRSRSAMHGGQWPA